MAERARRQRAWRCAGKDRPGLPGAGTRSIPGHRQGGCERWSVEVGKAEPNVALVDALQRLPAELMKGYLS